MELDDINSVNPIGDHETNVYENLKITSATLEKTENSQPKQTENVEGLYETLTLGRKSNDRKTLTLLEKDTIKRMKCFIYVILTLVIVLFIGIIALTIVVAIPKAQDGGWSNWETWGTCSDSCGGGIKSRNRSCSNPAPSLYGKQCIGNFEQLSLCNKQLCRETDGGWSNWETWGTCSDSCGGGIKSRNRSCSNPAPSLHGKQCMGNSEQVSLCNKQLCRETDGGWSNWETWNACTDSCGGGIKSRNRSCSNPAPSLLGKQCLGNSEQAIQFNKQMCPGTDGVWSVWEDWGPCTDSCGGGVRTRSRSCTNPTPSMSGRPCTGDYIDVSTCNKTTCPDHNVAFTAYDIYRNSSNYSILRFRNTYINNGDGYDTTTGKFTCSVPGVYHFVMTLTKFNKDINYIYAYLRTNGKDKLYLIFDPKDDGSNEVGIYMMTVAGTFHLNQNDVVYVYGKPDYFSYGQYSYFTGFLTTQDH